MKRRKHIDIRHGDVIAELRKMPERSVHMVVSSPPYYGLRHYNIPASVWGGSAECQHVFPESTSKTLRGKVGDFSTIDGDQDREGNRPQVIDTGSFCACGAWRGCHGLEPTLSLDIMHEVMIWREVRRVLRDDGTLWLNLGDSYCTTAPGTGVAAAKHQGKQTIKRLDTRPAMQEAVGPRDFMRPTTPDGLKPKDIMGVPWRVFFALQDDGWYGRSGIVWHKTNPMPGSQGDRPTSSYEFVFLLAKSPIYYYDKHAVMTKASTNTHARSAAAAAFPSEALRDEDKGRRRANKPNSWQHRAQLPRDKPEQAQGRPRESREAREGRESQCVILCGRQRRGGLAQPAGRVAGRRGRMEAVP